MCLLLETLLSLKKTGQNFKTYRRLVQIQITSTFGTQLSKPWLLCFTVQLKIKAQHLETKHKARNPSFFNNEKHLCILRATQYWKRAVMLNTSCLWCSEFVVCVSIASQKRWHETDLLFSLGLDVVVLLRCHKVFVELTCQSLVYHLPKLLILFVDPVVLLFLSEKYAQWNIWPTVYLIWATCLDPPHNTTSAGNEIYTLSTKAQLFVVPFGFRFIMMATIYWICSTVWSLVLRLLIILQHNFLQGSGNRTARKN